MSFIQGVARAAFAVCSATIPNYYPTSAHKELVFGWCTFNKVRFLSGASSSSFDLNPEKGKVLTDSEYHPTLKKSNRRANGQITNRKT